MKNIFYSMLSGFIFTALFISCEDVNDQFDELDSLTEITNLAAYNHTLVDADYTAIANAGGAAASSINTNKYFTIDLPASEYVPYLLKTKYPYSDVGSTAMITYDFNEARPTYIDDFENANSYFLARADYASSGSTIAGFYPDVNPSTYLANILTSKISAPIEGQITAARYTQYIEMPEITTTTNYIIEDNFSYGSTAGDLLTVSGGAWASHSGTLSQLQYTNTNLSMEGYPSSNVGGSILLDAFGSEDLNSEFAPISSGVVYASTLINLSSVADGTYFLHFKDAETNYTGRVGAMSDGAGKVLFGIGATSSSLTYGTTAFDLDTTYLLVVTYDIDNGISNLYVLTSVEATEPATPEATNTGSSGKVVQSIAVRQGWQGPSAILDGIRVATSWKDIMENDVVEDVAGAKSNKESYYKFSNGNWSAAQGIYALTTEDYNSMGTGGGEPGQYDNFSSSINPENYIPTLLSKLYPYAQNGNKLAVSYKYYSGGTQTRVDEYIFQDEKWSNPSSVISKTEQFVFSNTGWVFDPTVKIIMEKADYQLMVDYVLATPSISKFANPTYKNEEYYYGFGSRYDNINFRLSYRNPYFTGSDVQPASMDPELNGLSTDAEKVALLWTRLQEGMMIFLQQKYPSAVPNVGGIEVSYHATTTVYYPTGVSSGSENHTFIFKCTAAASGSTPPQFEFVSESITN